MAYVEAASMGVITQLASNPPRYPRNPTEPKRQSLVLYIQRVPGSRDVILTPLKPRRKNVTAEDVAASLYFLHYQNSDDEELSQEVAEVDLASLAPTPSVPRKPLAEDHINVSNKIHRRLSPDALGSVRRKQAPDLSRHLPVVPIDTNKPDDTGPRIQRDIVDEPNHEASTPETISIQTSPISPRKLTSSSNVTRKAAPSQPTSQISQSSADKPPPALPPRPTPTNLSDVCSDTLSFPEPPEHITSRSSRIQYAPLAGFKVTLIRRDLTSGAQWNVGEISSRNSSDTFVPSGKKSHAMLDVHLTSPGYLKFRGGPLPNSFEIMDDASQHSGPSTSFNRQICMNNVNTVWDSAKRHARTASDLSSTHSETRGRASVESSRSANYPPILDSNEDVKDAEKSRAKGYVFVSPWDGRCQFRTGVSGRSLRCKHSLPDSVAGSNAMGGTSSTAVTISELRFNLPTSTVFGATPNTFGLDTKKLKAPKLAGLKNRLSQPDGHGISWRETLDEMFASSEEDEDDRLDLRLGQEKAGGGNRGGRVKLGKLIIHDEGLKMLDLVVAANMGIWWQTWER